MTMPPVAGSGRGPTGGGMFTFRLSLEGEVLLSRRLRAVAGAADDLSPAWVPMRELFFQFAAAAFDSEGASTGEAWPQLVERTIADRLAHGFPGAHPILHRRGTLRESLTSLTSNTLYATTPQSLQIGSLVEYFAYHQSRRPRTRIPRRAPINLTADQRHQLFLPLRRHLTGHDPSAPVRSRPRP